MCTREEFLKVFDNILETEINDLKQNYQIPETAINWINAVCLFINFE